MKSYIYAIIFTILLVAFGFLNGSFWGKIFPDDLLWRTLASMVTGFIFGSLLAFGLIKIARNRSQKRHEEFLRRIRRDYGDGSNN